MGKPYQIITASDRTLDPWRKRDVERLMAQGVPEEEAMARTEPHTIDVVVPLLDGETDE